MNLDISDCYPYRLVVTAPPSTSYLSKDTLKAPKSTVKLSFSSTGDDFSILKLCSIMFVSEERQVHKCSDVLENDIIIPNHEQIRGMHEMSNILKRIQNLLKIDTAVCHFPPTSTHNHMLSMYCVCSLIDEYNSEIFNFLLIFRM